eukprot:Rhum_TRINITY_DN22983_c0_g1::Rhum_TRINITY_DN22983_c0_g1_i1::g.176558::m.176558
MLLGRHSSLETDVFARVEGLLQLGDFAATFAALLACLAFRHLAFHVEELVVVVICLVEFGQGFFVALLPLLPQEVHKPSRQRKNHQHADDHADHSADVRVARRRPVGRRHRGGRNRVAQLRVQENLALGDGGVCRDRRRCVADVRAHTRHGAQLDQAALRLVFAVREVDLESPVARRTDFPVLKVVREAVRVVLVVVVAPVVACFVHGAVRRCAAVPVRHVHDRHLLADGEDALGVARPVRGRARPLRVGLHNGPDRSKLALRGEEHPGARRCTLALRCERLTRVRKRRRRHDGLRRPVRVVDGRRRRL